MRPSIFRASKHLDLRCSVQIRLKAFTSSVAIVTVTGNYYYIYLLTYVEVENRKGVSVVLIRTLRIFGTFG